MEHSFRAFNRQRSGPNPAEFALEPAVEHSRAY